MADPTSPTSSAQVLTPVRRELGAWIATRSLLPGSPGKGVEMKTTIQGHEMDDDPGIWDGAETFEAVST